MRQVYYNNPACYRIYDGSDDWGQGFGKVYIMQNHRATWKLCAS